MGTDEHLIKDNFSKMKDYLLNKMFDRIALYIKAVKDEPYVIKNALYLLDKLEIIPAFKQQAEELEVYMKDLKERFYALKDMKPIIDRIIGILNRKKTTLPERPIVDDKKRPAGGATQTPSASGPDKSPVNPSGSNNGPSGTPQVGGSGQHTPQQLTLNTVDSAISQPSAAPVEKSKNISSAPLVSDSKPRQEPFVRNYPPRENPRDTPRERESQRDPPRGQRERDTPREAQKESAKDYPQKDSLR